MGSLKEGISNGFSTLKEKLGFLFDIVSVVKDKVSSLLELNEALRDKVHSMYLSIVEIALDFKELPGNLYEKIIEALKLIFLPSDDFLEEKFDSIKNKLAWYKDIENNSSVIYSFIKTAKGDKPPVINYDVPAKTSGRWKIDGFSVHIDFTWYEKYKPDVDALLGSILMVVFVFNLFKNLPGIISGSSAITDMISSVRSSDSGSKGGRNGS